MFCSPPLLLSGLFFSFPFTVLIQLNLDSTAVCFFLVWIFVLEKDFDLFHFMSLRPMLLQGYQQSHMDQCAHPHVGSFKAFLVLRLAHRAFQLVSLVTVGHWKSSCLLTLLLHRSRPHQVLVATIGLFPSPHIRRSLGRPYHVFFVMAIACRSLLLCGTIWEDLKVSSPSSKNSNVC